MPAQEPHSQVDRGEDGFRVSFAEKKHGEAKKKTNKKSALPFKVISCLVDIGADMFPRTFPGLCTIYLNYLWFAVGLALLPLKYALLVCCGCCLRNTGFLVHPIRDVCYKFNLSIQKGDSTASSQRAKKYHRIPLHVYRCHVLRMPPLVLLMFSTYEFCLYREHACRTAFLFEMPLEDFSIWLGSSDSALLLC